MPNAGEADGQGVLHSKFHLTRRNGRQVLSLAAPNEASQGREQKVSHESAQENKSRGAMKTKLIVTLMCFGCGVCRYGTVNMQTNSDGTALRDSCMDLSRII